MHPSNPDCIAAAACHMSSLLLPGSSGEPSVQLECISVADGGCFLQSMALSPVNVVEAPLHSGLLLCRFFILTVWHFLHAALSIYVARKAYKIEPLLNPFSSGILS